MCLIFQRQLSTFDIRLNFIHRMRFLIHLYQLKEQRVHRAEFSSKIVYCASNHSIQFLNNVFV